MSSSDIDQPRPIREGEMLDVVKLGEYLKARLPDLVDASDLAVEQFPGGYSNLTYRMSAGDYEWVLRRPPFGNRVKTAHDMGREFRVLDALRDVYEPAPRPYLHREDESIIGAPFYVMERRRGVILRKPESLPREYASLVGDIGRAAVRELAKLHSLDYRAAGLGDLGKPDGYVERQVSGWTRRFENARTGETPGIDRCATWLAQNLPESPPASLIHNDYKFDNLIIDPDEPTRIIALLDWEMASLGDPLSDVGTTLGYWVDADDPSEFRALAFGPTAIEGSLNRREFVDLYGEISGRDTSAMLFYYVLGLFKIAGIVQQIYSRFVRGDTKDPRFAGLDTMVKELGRQGTRAIDSGTI